MTEDFHIIFTCMPYTNITPIQLLYYKSCTGFSCFLGPLQGFNYYFKTLYNPGSGYLKNWLVLEISPCVLWFTKEDILQVLPIAEARLVAIQERAFSVVPPPTQLWNPLPREALLVTSLQSFQQNFLNKLYILLDSTVCCVFIYFSCLYFFRNLIGCCEALQWR